VPVQDANRLRSANRAFPDVGQDPRGTDRPDPGQFHQARAAVGDRLPQVGLDRFDLDIDADQVGAMGLALHHAVSHPAPRSPTGPAVAPWAGAAARGQRGGRVPGAVSFAAIFAVPHALDSGAPFPGRDLIVLVTCGVILLTLLQALLLPSVVRFARLPVDTWVDEEAQYADENTLDAAIEALEPRPASSASTRR